MKNSLPDLFNKYGGFFKTHGIRGKPCTNAGLAAGRILWSTKQTSVWLMHAFHLLGRSLFMLNDNLLLEMGILDAQDR